MLEIEKSLGSTPENKVRIYYISQYASLKMVEKLRGFFGNFWTIFLLINVEIKNNFKKNTEISIIKTNYFFSI